MLEVRMCGGLEVESDGRQLPDGLVGGRQGRLALAYLTCERHRPVARDELAELLWGDALPESWTASLSAVVSRLRRLLGEAGLDGSTALVSTAGSYQLLLPPDSSVDLEVLVAAVEAAEDAVDAADAEGALDAASRAEVIAARGFLADDGDWVDHQRDAVRVLAVRAALARSAAHGIAGSHRRAMEAARDALALDDRHEAAYRRLMRSLAAAGERGEALRVWERCRIVLAEELGVDPSPETEAVYLEILGVAEPSPAGPTAALPSGVVSFLLTDIVESSSLWEASPENMAVALERHDRIVAEVVAATGGTLLKSKLEGDATVSVFARATAGVNAALVLSDALEAEPWPGEVRPSVRMAVHTGEAFERDGDYFGPALNRAARLRSLAGPGQVLLSQAVAELVRDQLPDDVVLRDLGHRELRGLSRGENVFELALGGVPVPRTATESRVVVPPVPAALVGTGPFVGRSAELTRLEANWTATVDGAGRAVFVGGEPGVGKSRLAAELAERAHRGGAIVLYGRCDEDLGAPLQPFVEAMDALGAALGAERLRAVRGVEELARVVPGLAELLPPDAAARRADPDSERLAVFDAVTQVLRVACREVPVLLVLDDLHWAGRSTLSLLRHLLRDAAAMRLFVFGTYRDTELARSHPLAATLADLRRDGFAERMSLAGLDADDVIEYLAAMGHDNRMLGRELSEVTSGNPFFVIEVVRHIEESGGVWEPGSLPEGVREATGRRLSRLSERTNEVLTVAAVAGPSFDLGLVEQLEGQELTDEIAEACRAGLVLEDSGRLGRFRFAHALVRQVLLAELVSLKRVRLHRAIAELLEVEDPRDDDRRLVDLAYHWYECAPSGGAAKAVDACRRAGDRAMERLAYEEAGDLYGMALQALEALGGDDAGDATAASLHLARCDALLTAGDVVGARAAIDALEAEAEGSERMAAWYATYEGLLAVLAEPDRLHEIVRSIGAAATAMAAVGDLEGEAKAHFVHASALERLGQIGAAERALDRALAAARDAGDRRLADAILAEVPPAALWGPQPVPRASGNCLDVIRVLRITEGAPAVEAVALRCQGVLEALRGRTDAARRMIGSARRTFERLGLAHRLLEVDVAAGFVELVAGEADRAEPLLRRVATELRARGLDGEAAQAGAFLGRTLLLQGQVDEADAVAAEAAALAGSDLTAGIVWRGVRAESAARRGELDVARALADEAVRLAAATDAMVLVADARLSRAAVLQLAGDPDGAAAEAARAAEACEAKGASALLSRVAATGALRSSPTRSSVPEPRRRVGAEAQIGEGGGRLAVAAARRDRDAANRRDFDALRANHTARRIIDDRRRVIGVGIEGDDTDHMRFVLDAPGSTFTAPEVLDARGERVALLAWTLRAPDFEVSVLIVVRSDALGRIAECIVFDADDVDRAGAALDEVAGRAAEQAFENDASAAQRRWQARYDAGALDELAGFTAPDYVLDDRRPLVGGSYGGEQVLAGNWLLAGGGAHLETEVLATRGRSVVLSRVELSNAEYQSDASVVVVVLADEQGRYQRSVAFDDDQFDEALAELDRTFVEHEAGEHAAILDRLRVDDAARSLIVEHVPRVSGTAVLRVVREVEGGEAWLEVVRHDGEVVLGVERFAVADLDSALLRIDELEAEPSTGGSGPVRPNQLSRTAERLDQPLEAAGGRPSELVESEPWANQACAAVTRLQAALESGDASRLTDALSPRYEYDEHRPILRHEHARQDDAGLRGAARELRDVSVRSEVLATRGEHLVLTRDVLQYHHELTGPSEMELVSVVTCDDDGRVERTETFEIGELDAARDALEQRAIGLGGPDVDGFVGAIAARDWTAFEARLDPACTLEDRRHPGSAVLHRPELVGAVRDRFDRSTPARLLVDHLRWQRGGWLALCRIEAHGVELPERRLIVVASSIASGRPASLVLFDADDLDRARAQFDRLVIPGANAAWRMVVATEDAINARDPAAFASLLSPDYTLEDRRTGVRMLSSDREGALADNRFLLTLDDLHERLDLIESRGERFVLFRLLVRFRDGQTGLAEIECVQVAEMDEVGRERGLVAFDADDLDAAMAELDRRAASESGVARSLSG